MTATLPTVSRETLLSLEPALRAEIRGQSHVIPRVVSVLHRGQLGLSKPGRPRGSFLFLGPTGVGKTEPTQAFTRHLFGAEKLLRFDMSEFQTQDSLGLLQLEIAEKFLRKEIAFLRTQGHNLTVDDFVLPFLVRKGFHPKLGARPMRDAVEKSIGDAVAGNLLAGGDANGRLQVDERTDVLLIVRNVCEACVDEICNTPNWKRAVGTAQAEAARETDR